MIPWIPYTGPEGAVPRIGERVLVTRQKGDDLIVEQANYQLNGWWKVYGANVRRIIAWAYMPEPYRGDE